MKRYAGLSTVAAAITHAVARTAHPCSPETFTALDLYGASFQSISAAAVHNYKGNPNWTPEAIKISPDGPTFCNVSVTYTHPGLHDVINVEVWLPLESLDWNERFVGVGGGGFATGELGGDPITALVSQGYAAASTDGGHDHRDVFTSPWALSSPGNVNYNLLINYAYRALHDMTVIGKTITQQYYGRAATYSYWHGCSTGGRQGLVVAQRYPEDYDGILAACPAVNFAALVAGGFWPQLVMDRLGEYPPRCELDAIVTEAIAACDELDGLKDGVIAAPDECGFDPEAVVGKAIECAGVPSHISAAAAQIAKATWNGPRSRAGTQLSFGSPIGTPLTGSIALANTLCANGTCSGRPFPIVVDWIKLFVQKNPDFDIHGMSLADYERVMHQSQQEYNGIIGSNDPDLSDFQRLGGKMLTWHGVNDELISMRSTRDYYTRAMAANERIQEFYRYFEVPGVNHCYGPPGSAYPLHALDVLRRWVENGTVPDMLDAVTLGNESDGPERRRPLCPYPLLPEYDAAGGDGRCVERRAGSAAIPTRDEL